jgi:hypothetical protein
MRWTGRSPRGRCRVLDLKPIKDRVGLKNFCDYGLTSDPDWIQINTDINALVAEVEALREQHAELIAFLVSVPSSMQCACGRTVTLDVGSG